jgi:hypothetical protein
MAGGSTWAVGCCLCRRKPAPQRGMELYLRRQAEGRLVLRESDGLIPLCQSCLSQLVVERPHPIWPALLLALGVGLLVRGYTILGGAALLLGLAGAARALLQPGQRALRLRLRRQVLLFGSMPLAGFEEHHVAEVVLERRLSVRYKDDGTVEVEVLHP